MALIAEDTAIRDDNLQTQLVFLGDYVDRGPDSKGVVDRLLTIAQTHPNAVFLKGNHEAAMLDFLSDPADMRHWLDWGGRKTLHSYGATADPKDGCDAIAAAFAQAMPDEHLRFFQSLRLHHIEGDYLFVHAGLRPGRALKDQREEDLLWIRKRFHNAKAHERPTHTVVHGHHPVAKPVDAGWRIGVDTGACYSGRLSAVVLEGQSRRFITAAL